MKRFFTDFKMGFKLLMLCLFIGGSVQSWGQLNYPNQGFETTADDDDWDQGGFFVRTSNSVCGSTKMMQDNLYSSIPQATLYNETTMGTTNGGIVTVSFDFSYTNYSGPSTFTVDAKWCSSKNAGCTVIASYTQADFAVGTCVTKTPTYSAPASANNFLAFEVKRLTGDFYPNFDNISALEQSCTPPAISLTLGTDTGTTDDTAITLTGGTPTSGGTGTYSATCGACVTGTTFNPCLAGVGTHTITYTFDDGVCPGSATDDFTVTAGSSSGTLYVDYDNGNDGTGTGSVCQPFKSIGRAYNAASDGDVIQAILDPEGDDIDEDGFVYLTSMITVSKSVTIDGGGNTYVNNSTGTGAFQLQGSGKNITIKNMTLCSFNRTGAFGAAIYVADMGASGLVTIDGVHVTNSESGNDAVRLEGNTDIKNSSISGNDKIGLHIKPVRSGTIVNIDDTNIDCNNSLCAGYGGGIHIDGSGSYTVNVTITGGSISNNSVGCANVAGGGIYFNGYGASILNITETVFAGNEARELTGSVGGGAIYANDYSSSGAQVNVTNAYFESNESSNGAAAINVADESATITGCVFRNNVGSAVTKGIGSYSNCIFQGNSGTMLSASTSFIQSSVSGYTTDFNHSGIVTGTCSGTCTPNAGYAIGESISGPSPCATPGGILTSTTTGQWYYQQGSTVTAISGETGMTVAIPSGLSGFTVFWQDVAMGTAPIVGFTIGAGITATAGDDDATIVNTAVTLDGNTPGAGNTGTWSITSGPDTDLAQFGNVNTYNTAFTPTMGGSYTLKWTVTDGSCPNEDEVVITATAPLTVSGTVYSDGDGLTAGGVDGVPLNGTPAGALGVQMYVNLVLNGAVVASVALGADGTYSFPSVSPNATGASGYTLVLSTSAVSTTATPPAGWMFTGDDYGTGNAAGTGTDATTPGAIALETGVTSVTALNMGMNQIPIVTTNIAPPQTSTPTGTDNLDVAGLGIFGAMDNQTTITYITLKSFPTGATSFKVAGTTYYPTAGDIPGGCVSCAAFPAAGVDVSTDGTGAPAAGALLVDPAFEGAGGDIVFTYTTTDEAGAESAPGTGTISFILPVELVYFSAKAADCQVQLAWQTATEINNAYFEIQRSRDGQAFETIGKVTGAGTAEIAQTYNFTDRNPMANNYYRLKQVDFDGRFDYSAIQIANTEDCQGTGVIHAYPNPVSDNLTVELNTEKATNGQIVVFDYSGKQILQLSVNLEKGTNILPVTTADLQSGIYFMQMTYDNQVSEIVKFVKK